MRYPRRPISLAIGLVIVGALVILPYTDVLGYDFELSSRTETSVYNIRQLSDLGIDTLTRRRLTQILGLRVFDLFDSKSAAQWKINILFRFQSDFGTFGMPTDQIPKLVNDHVDLRLGTLEATDLFGILDLSFGRQINTADMGFFAYDGLRLRFKGPYTTYVEVDGGFAVSGEHTLGFPTFEADGTSREDNHGGSIAPTYALSAGFALPQSIEMRLAYRYVASRTQTAVPRDPERSVTQWGVKRESLSAHFLARLPRAPAHTSLGLRYNAVVGIVDEAYLALFAYPNPAHNFELSASLVQPVFDGNSIFNVFETEAYWAFLSRYTWTIRKQWSLEGTLSLLHYLGEERAGKEEEEEDENRQQAVSAFLGLLRAVYQGDSLRGDLSVRAIDGAQGSHIQGAAGGSWYSNPWAFNRRLYITAYGRLSSYRDPLRNLSKRLMTYSLEEETKLQLLPNIAVSIRIEQMYSRRLRWAFRALSVLDMRFDP